MQDNKNKENINDLGENKPITDDLSDRASLLTQDITAKIEGLSKELDAILLDIQKAKEEPLIIDTEKIDSSLDKKNIDIESLITDTPDEIKESKNNNDLLIENPIIVDNRTIDTDKKEEKVIAPIVFDDTKGKEKEITKDNNSHKTQNIVKNETPVLETLNNILDKLNPNKKDVKETDKEMRSSKKAESTASFIANQKTKDVNVDIQTKPIENITITEAESKTKNSTNVKKVKKKTSKKTRRPKGKKVTFVFAILACIVLFLGLCGAGGAIYFAYKLCENKPEFSPAALESPDSTIIYDSEGNQIIELGLYLRQNIEYDELPNCVVDAFVSIEDSRYFEHFGFDIPRFTKAIIENLRTMSFGQGGSTITMQLVKNSYFQIDDDTDSTMAAREGMSGVQRKMQEIVLALEANQALSKQEILTLYLNKVNFGDNIRGIQKAAEYYFGKDARELTLNEAAFLAGIINAPNGNNPYNAAYGNIDYLNNANARKNEVLDLMAYHGYITKEEAELNKNVKMENILAGKDEKFGITNTYYQSFIDAVINEAQEVTGKNPYTTAMNIYTSMDPYMQKYVYDMQNEPEKFADKYVFRHDLQQNALVVLNNQTGELVALGGGRNQADEARQFNRAIDSYINPGSSIKPVLEYCLAFDRLGYATSHTICDQPVFLYETDIVITNAYGQGYTGDMQITEALARSLNTPAVQLLEEVIDKIGEEEVIKYCQSIGFDWCNKDTFDIQWAIGGKDCLVSPVQLAGAHAMLMHGGMYIKPHTISRIEYRGKYNETPDYVADTVGTRVVSPAAAYMTAYCENYNVNSGWIGQLNLLKRNYPTYAKTGTTNFSEAAYVNYNIPETGAKDQWLCTQTSNYTIVVWNGFDKLEDDAYFTVTDENYNLKCKMGSILLDALMDHYQYDASGVKQPDDCIEINHLLGCFPYAYGSNAKGLISKNSEYAELVDAGSIVKEVKGGKLYHMGAVPTAEGMYVHWDEFNAYLGDGTVDTSVTSVSGKKTVISTGRSYYPRYNFANPGGFFATITAASGEVTSVESATPTALVEIAGVGPYTVCGWTASNPYQVCNGVSQ